MIERTARCLLHDRVESREFFVGDSSPLEKAFDDLVSTQPRTAMYCEKTAMLSWRARVRYAACSAGKRYFPVDGSTSITPPVTIAPQPFAHVPTRSARFFRDGTSGRRGSLLMASKSPSVAYGGHQAEVRHGSWPTGILRRTLPPFAESNTANFLASCMTCSSSIRKAGRSPPGVNSSRPPYSRPLVNSIPFYGGCRPDRRRFGIRNDFPAV